MSETSKPVYPCATCPRDEWCKKHWKCPEFLAYYRAWHDRVSRALSGEAEEGGTGMDRTKLSPCEGMCPDKAVCCGSRWRECELWRAYFHERWKWDNKYHDRLRWMMRWCEWRNNE